MLKIYSDFGFRACNVSARWNNFHIDWTPSTCRRVKRPKLKFGFVTASLPMRCCVIGERRRLFGGCSCVCSQIPITSTNLSLLKVEIGQRLPDVKSSHRCEAIARGLGFGTYAAFRAAAQSPNASSVTASASEFQSYLVAKGFSAPLKPFYVAVARLAVSAVLLRAPKLTSHGIGIGRPRRTPNGSWESLEQRQVKFAEGRKELLCDRYIEAFILCLDFLSLVGRTKTIRPRTNSYWIKHIAENFHCAYPEGEMLGPKYVPNGVLIAAAMHAGFNLKTHDDGTGFDSLNVTFNMSEPSLKRLDQEIRQRGRTAA